MKPATVSLFHNTIGLVSLRTPGLKKSAADSLTFTDPRAVFGKETLTSEEVHQQVIPAVVTVGEPEENVLCGLSNAQQTYLYKTIWKHVKQGFHNILCCCL